MVDIHCHIIYGMDDGSEDAEESMAMCKTAIDNNITVIVATPHFLSFYETSDFFKYRDARIAHLNTKLKKQEKTLIILPGAEVACSDDMFYYNDLDKLTINNGKYLLLEFPFTQTDESRLIEYAGWVFSSGLIPVIAHPERFEACLSNYDLINELSDRGCLFQINCGSAIGKFGRRAKALALSMLRAGFADVLATDAHSAGNGRITNLNDMVSQIPDKIPGELIFKAVNENPLNIIADKPVKTNRKGYIKKGLFV